MKLRPSLEWLLMLVPLAVVLRIVGGPELGIFLASAAAILMTLISLDGESNWLEGAQPTGACGIMAVSFFFVEHV